MIAIIDYNMGNIASIENIFKKLNKEVIATADLEVLRKADKFILPGIGAFDYGIQNLNNLGITDFLKEQVIDIGKPILGICLGMQLLTEDSEEGELPGLGFIKAHTKKFKYEWNGRKLKIPHMGWNYVYANNDVPIFKNSFEDMRFYFVHSYYVECEEQNDIIGTTEYGNNFTSAVGKNNIFGVQFHPEKSHKYGMNLLKNFAEMM